MESIELSKIFALGTKPHTLRVPEEIMNEMKKNGRKYGRKLSANVTYALAKYLQEESQNA